jgi:hypothetical protein
MAERKVKLLRLDQDLYDALERWAADDLRSVNAQIEFLLRESLRRAGRLPSDPTGAPLRGSPDPSGPDPSERDRAGPDG